jgi:hypothetical protein
MDDLKTRLERLSRRVEDRPDALMRLERRRHVRARTRRLTAGLLAIGIGVMGTVTAYSILTTPTPREPAAASGPLAALWPEHSAEELRATEDAVDAGDPAVQWRLNPKETAFRFARSVLGWTSPDERFHGNASEAPSGLVTVDVFTVPTSCHEESCDVVHEAIIHLWRLGERDGGIWSVISAESSVFNMQFRIGQAVRVGQDLEVISGHPSGSEIAIGVKVFEPCSGFHGGTATVQNYRVSVPIVGIEEGCVGYVYALTPAAAGQDRLGRSLFDATSGTSRHAIDSIAVAPVFIVASDGSGSGSDIPQPEEA